MINPEIVNINQELEVDEEGCLSLPGVKGDVTRPNKLTVAYMNPAGKKMRLMAQ
jgi:peptide deformylase